MFQFFREDIQTIISKDPAARGFLDVMTYPGLWAMVWHRVPHVAATQQRHLLSQCHLVKKLLYVLAHHARLAVMTKKGLGVVSARVHHEI